MTTKQINARAYWLAVSFALLSAACLAAAAAFGKYLTTMGSLPIVIFIRFFCPLLLVVTYSLVRNKLHLNTTILTIHIARACFAVGAQFAFFYVLTHASILMGNLLYATSGLFSPLITWMLLRTRIPLKTCIAIMVSFIGVSIALNIWQDQLSAIAWIGLLSGILGSASQLTQHRASKTDSKNTANILLYGFGSLFSLIILLAMYVGGTAIHLYTRPSLTSLEVILLFSCLSIGNQTFKSTAFKQVNKAASLAPFFYMAIPFAGVLDWYIYATHPAWNIWLGTIIIIAGVAIMSVRKPSSKDYHPA